MSDPIQLTVLCLSFQKPRETRECLASIRAHLKVPYKLVLLDNGGAPDYAWQLYKEGLCDVLISKRVGAGGGFGQTDLFRWSDTTHSLFLQCDQVLLHDISPEVFERMTWALDHDYQCVDLNGDQSGCGIWTDRAHLMKTSLFNSCGPFPNGGPGNDSIPWNEEHMQRTFKARGHRIAHVQPLFFADCGRWSVREAGDGLYRHRCDLKTLYVLKRPTVRTEIYPPLNDQEWESVLAGTWVDGTIPEAWKAHSFRAWPDDPEDLPQ